MLTKTSPQPQEPQGKHPGTRPTSATVHSAPLRSGVSGVGRVLGMGHFSGDFGRGGSSEGDFGKGRKFGGVSTPGVSRFGLTGLGVPTAGVSGFIRMVVVFLAVVAMSLAGAGIPRAMASEGPTGTGEVTVNPAGIDTSAAAQAGAGVVLPALGPSIQLDAGAVDAAEYENRSPATLTKALPLSDFSQTVPQELGSEQAAAIVQVGKVLVAQAQSGNKLGLEKASAALKVLAAKDGAARNELVRAILAEETPSVPSPGQFTRLTGFSLASDSATRDQDVTLPAVENQALTVVEGNLPTSPRLVPIAQPSLAVAVFREGDNAGAGNGGDQGGDSGAQPGTTGEDSSGSAAGIIDNDALKERIDSSINDALGADSGAANSSAGEPQEDPLRPFFRMDVKPYKVETIEPGMTVTDTVRYFNLIPGRKYTLKTRVVDFHNTSTVLGEASTDFTPEKESGMVEASVTLESGAATAKVLESIVSSEVDAQGNQVTGETLIVDKPNNPMDINQLVKSELTPEVTSTAALSDDGASVVDTVTYTDLVPGKEYQLVAELRDRDNPATVVGTATHTFTPKASSGTEKITIPLNSESTATTVVVYQTLQSAQVDREGAPSQGISTITKEDKLINPSQTVTLTTNAVAPTITTKATLKGHKISKGTTVVDTVSYTGLVPGKQYTLSGDLIDTSDGKTKLGHGSMVFTPTAPDGTVENIIEIRADGPVPEGVVVESLYSTEVDAQGKETHGSELIAQEKDLSNPAQTVRSTYSPSISTKAVMNKKQIVEGVTVVDRVTYTDLVPGQQYILRGQLVDKNDPTVILGSGERVFTPTKGNGDVTVPITVSVPGPVGVGVVYETLVSRGVDKEGKPAQGEAVIAEHKDLSDAAQTVTSELDPTITTEASLESSEIRKDVVVTDTVHYEDLIPGKQYTMYGVLVNPEDMTPAGMTTQPFVPEESDGELTMPIAVRVDGPLRKLVVFEILKSTQVDKNGLAVSAETEIAAERDIENKKQTVTGRVPRQEPADAGEPGEDADADAEQTEPGYEIHISASRSQTAEPAANKPAQESEPTSTTASSENAAPDANTTETATNTPVTSAPAAGVPVATASNSTASSPRPSARPESRQPQADQRKTEQPGAAQSGSNSPVTTPPAAAASSTVQLAPAATQPSGQTNVVVSSAVSNPVVRQDAANPSTGKQTTTTKTSSSVQASTSTQAVHSQAASSRPSSPQVTTSVQAPEQALAPKAQRVVITSIPSGPTGDLLNTIPEVVE